MFDVEEIQGSSGTMVPAFVKAFAAVKHAGLAGWRDHQPQRAVPVRHARGRRGLGEGVGSANVDFPHTVRGRRGRERRGARLLCQSGHQHRGLLRVEASRGI